MWAWFLFFLFSNNLFWVEEIGRDTQMLAPMTTKGILASLGK
jgi:hypothetical protein